MIAVNTQSIDSSVTLDLEITRRRWAREAVQDEKARSNPALRVGMTRLISQIGELIGEIADESVTAGDSFAADDMRELLTWQLAEFLTDSVIERGQDGGVYDSLIKWYQFSERHANTFFDTTRHGVSGTVCTAETEIVGQAAPDDPPNPETLREVIARVATAASGEEMDTLIDRVLIEKPAPVGYEVEVRDMIRQWIEDSDSDSDSDSD